jgi:hypothetical protein
MGDQNLWVEERANRGYCTYPGVTTEEIVAYYDENLVKFNSKLYQIEPRFSHRLWEWQYRHIWEIMKNY